MPPTIALSKGWPLATIPGDSARLAHDVLPAYLMAQRWFPSKARTLAHVEVEETVPLGDEGAALLVVAASYDDGVRHRFAMPVAAARGDEASRVREASPARVLAALEGDGVLHDDMGAGIGARLLDGIASGRQWPAGRGVLCGEATGAFAALRGSATALPARQVTAEQSNTSVIFGDRLIMKVIRRLEPGLNPDYEIGRHLTEVARFPGVPALAGALVWRGADAEPIVVGIVQALVAGAKPLRERIVAEVARSLRDRVAAPGPFDRQAWRQESAALFAEARVLGQRTAALHLALADARGDEAFVPEPATAGDLAAVTADMQANAAAAVELLESRLDAIEPASREVAATIVARRERLLEAIGRVAHVVPGVARIRVHGDYQLDQVLEAGGEFVVIDFEGEPLRPLPERRGKFLAMKDVAGMARSYSYAAYAALFEAAGEDGRQVERLEPLARWWQAEAGQAFVDGYRERAGAAAFVPESDADWAALLEAFVVEKATYELRYELGHRPAWLRIPLLGVAGILGSGS